MKSDEMRLVKISVRLNSALIQDLEDLCTRRGLTSISEGIRTYLHPAVKAELQTDYTIEADKLRIEAAKVKIAERELAEAERTQEVQAKRQQAKAKKQELEAEEVKLKKEKLEAQQLENLWNPHLAG